MLSTEIEKLAKLVVENDLLFKIAENWGKVPVYVEDTFSSYQRTIAIGNNLEDYQSLSAHLNRCLKVCYDDGCTVDLVAIIWLLDRYRKIIEQVIDDPDPDRYIPLLINGRKHKTKIKDLLNWFMILGDSEKDIKLEGTDNE